MLIDSIFLYFVNSKCQSRLARESYQVIFHEASGTWQCDKEQGQCELSRCECDLFAAKAIFDLIGDDKNYAYIL